MTDLAIYLGPIRANIEANKEVIKGEAAADELDWAVDVDEKMKGTADIVMVSDCIYYEMSLEPLVKVIQSLSHQNSKIILSYERRQEKLALYEKFFELISFSFQVELISELSIENGNSVFIIKLSVKR